MAKQIVLDNQQTREGGKAMKPILVVEDEAIMRESLRDWLADGGYPVETAEHGEEALKAIGKQDFGLLIVDLKLPGKNGLEVLREARAQKPQLNSIIITAYPSILTAVEAMKIGAIDYLPKPFSLDTLEELIQETLGPVHVKIKPKAPPKTAIAKAPPAEEAKVEEIIAIAPEEIPVHLKQGKEHFEAGHYTAALREFESILSIAPGNIETRVWIRKTKEALAEPKVKAVAEGEAAPVAEEVKPKECVWVKMGLVAYRLCTRDYDCLTCEFDQTMQEKMARGETPELDQALERFKELPGSQRLCRYALKGDVSYRVCTRVFQCTVCEFGQMMEDALQQKLAKLQARREALLKKEQKAKA
ncbi:MAG: response regulator [Dehalococcoidia bacterium]|nr:response regulator [Dehalococcoidia bacterium]